MCVCVCAHVNLTGEYILQMNAINCTELNKNFFYSTVLYKHPQTEYGGLVQINAIILALTVLS